MDQAQAMVFLANAWLKISSRNFDNKVTDVSQLNLEADEREMIVCYTTSTTNSEETAEVPLDDLDRKLRRRIQMRLANSCAEFKSKEQTDLRFYFTNGKKYLVCTLK
ncbi:hypothetical protein RO3G_09325 [Rhizopus delemar RA 99-880]|uniref:Uncharacterized protein n=1 Tax=Rhizopus delemar (strain RA 99-880 / ATCC MYA-4621 / FGSC 9543 / NRRL 43880) TaxID=246409 RepID=I1C835_RHIO9|nr:hypothetical protein RO3G_09325 [Rhizopus delemar RA 99-880]|eukprot:EIE84615.1 hypothetical protein RO3G_09325 [Rhizopus delemar RA 99-880]